VREAAQTVKARSWAEVDETQFDRWIGGRSYANRALAYAAIRWLLSLLNDPTTRFLTPGQVQALPQDLEERGVKSAGLTEVLRLDLDPRSNSVIVISPTPGSPAAAAGLRTGDAIEAVGWTETDGMAVHDVAALIRQGRAEQAVLRW
jgi:C-terminal processing protease CtpA/Prc